MVFDCMCFFLCFFFGYFLQISLRLEEALKINAWRMAFPFGMAYLQGQTVGILKTSGTRGFSVVSGNSIWGPTIVAPISTSVVTGCFSTYLELDSTCS